MGEIQSYGMFNEIKRKTWFIVKKDTIFFSNTMKVCGLDFLCVVQCTLMTELLFLITKLWLRSSVADIAKISLTDMSILKRLLFISPG